MVSSQDTAIAAALHELGYQLPLRRGLAVDQGRPGRRQARGARPVVAVNGTPITAREQVVRSDPADRRRRAGHVRRTAAARRRRRSRSRRRRRRTTEAGRRRGADRHRLHFPFDVSVQPRRRHRRPQRRADVLARRLRHAHPGSLTGGTTSPAPEPSTARARRPDRRHPAEDRRRPRDARRQALPGAAGQLRRRPARRRDEGRDARW